MKYENINITNHTINFEPSDEDLKQIEKEVELLFDEEKNEISAYVKISIEDQNGNIIRHLN